ncbi:hypothetical protein V495_01426 [Pseudogymnoascus sp. VKM F-4514 (FW-929)]|nr:hypothetical protein V495_01426 [Pseudogymnoascus sp. VKM F-4514 (FW-929)]KFY56865.1 hypothetical protein V497_05941 [Pseudogymnoascus sp. VKM F-4516 (FW-969)]
MTLSWRGRAPQPGQALEVKFSRVIQVSDTGFLNTIPRRHQGDGLIVQYIALFILAVEATAWSHADMDLRHEFGHVLVPRQTANLQTFQDALGGAAAEAITNSDDEKRPFQVGDDTFTDFKSAASRSCDDQKNACAKIANGDNSNGLKVSDCDDQRDTCKSAQEKATVTSFGSSASSQAQVVTSDDEFTYFCDP